MKKHLPFVILAFLLATQLPAQIYLSNYMEGTVLVGPNNVTCDSKAIAANQMLEIDSLATHLRNTLKKNAKEINELEAKKKLNRKKQARLKSLKNQNTHIFEELKVLNEYYTIWKTAFKKQSLLVEFHKAFKANKCLEITTESDVYQPGEYEVKLEGNPKEMLCSESIQIAPTEFVTKWIKKKRDANCLSADPNDCLVWCQVDGPETVQFTGYNYIEYKLENCPDGFEYFEANSTCLRNYEILLNDASDQPISISRKSDYQILSLISWKEVSCE